MNKNARILVTGHRLVRAWIELHRVMADGALASSGELPTDRTIVT